ncbi:MAG: LicD family protein [Gammaproteobacteria bacterium]|nr:LicD family protein [Gammaproteobacteria bacterium]
MATRGYIERISRWFIAGWCVDDEVEGPVEVDVRVEGLSLGRVRADIPRNDIEKALDRRLAGFRFPISPELFGLLPHRAQVEVVVSSGETLPMLKGRDSRIDNPHGQGIGKLAEMLRGDYIINPKYGQIIRPLKNRNVDERVFRALEESNRIFEAQFSKKLFICYGTLLGCIRNNDFIPHDDDVDVCFLADGQGLGAAAKELRRVIKTLTDIGEQVQFDSSAQFHWGLQGTSLDVFMAWMEGDSLYMYNAGGTFSRNRIHPLVEREFKGRQVWVPNDSEALLELIYGPGWRVPDPSFQWRVTPEVRAKMNELNAIPVGDESTHNEIKDYWARFYAYAHTTLPSPFAAAVAIELTEPGHVVDLGCGNGRDSFFFAELGHRVVGLDVSGKAIGDNQARVLEKNVDDIEFNQVDVGAPHTLVDFLNRMEEAAIQAGDERRNQVAIYARFFFHAVSEEEEDLVLGALSQSLRSGARCFFEFRTENDAKGYKRFGSHYRRFINIDRFVEKATTGRPFECFYQVEGRGMAKYFEEDPFVGRVFLRRL